MKAVYLVRRVAHPHGYSSVQWATSGGWTTNLAYASNWSTAMDAGAVVHERRRSQRDSGWLATGQGPFRFQGNESLEFIINGISQHVHFSGSGAYVDLYIGPPTLPVLTITIDGGAPQLISFDADSDVHSIQQRINTQIYGTWTELLGPDELRIHSVTRGPASSIEINSEDVNYTGISSYGTGFAADLNAVTPQELASHYMEVLLPDAEVTWSSTQVTVAARQTYGERSIAVRASPAVLETLGYPVPNAVDEGKLEIVEMHALEVQPDRAVVSLPTNDPVLADYLEAFGHLEAANILRGLVKP